MRPSTALAPPRGALRLTSEGLAWLAAAAVLGLLGWSKSLNLLLMLAYVMAALLVLNGVLARMHARRVRVRRLVPRSVFAGESAETAVLVHNDHPRPATVQVADRNREWAVLDLPSGEAASFASSETFPKRGRVSLPPPVAISAFPFGFLRFERLEGEDDSVAVLPALGEADAEGMRRWLLRAAGGEGQSRKVLRRATLDQADVCGVRPYRPGDSMRAVHWRSSARRRELMVREYDAAPSPDLLLVVDPWLPADSSDADRNRLEAALSLAATVAATWTRAMGTRVALAVSGEATVFSGEASLRDSLMPLGDVVGSPSPAIPDVRTVGRIALQAARVVVSSRANSPWVDVLAVELGRPFAALDPGQNLPWYLPPKRGGES